VDQALRSLESRTPGPAARPFASLYDLATSWFQIFIEEGSLCLNRLS
jgi:hypothetical protein